MPKVVKHAENCNAHKRVIEVKYYPAFRFIVNGELFRELFVVNDEERNKIYICSSLDTLLQFYPLEDYLLLIR